MYNRKTQNLVHFLWLREANIYPGLHHPVPSHFLYHERNIYKCITPRCTVQNVDKPYGSLRKFTPDGRMLLSFSHDLKGIQVYEYQGVASVAYLLRPEEYEVLESFDHSPYALHVRKRLFEVLFDIWYELPLITTPSIGRHSLNREFTLFVGNGDYVILASTAGGSIFPDYLAYHYYSDLYDETDLYDYTFYLVHLRSGTVKDTLKLEHDFLILSHNHSVSLYDRTLAILSAYRQCVDLYEIDVIDGRFVRLFTLGPFGSDLDRDRVLAHQESINYALDPGRPMPLSHLKQKIIAYIYRNIMLCNNVEDRRDRLQVFYRNFLEYERMLVLKMQLIDSDHLLLRYENRPTQMPLETSYGNADILDKSFKFFVFYNFTEQRILKIYPQESIELLLLVRNHIDEFRNVRPFLVPWHASSHSNNIYMRSSFDLAFKSYAGGVYAATTRFNISLPVHSQSFSTSPYLDYSLFHYEDRYVSALERPRINGDEPVRFYDRKTEQLLYRAHLEELYNGSDSEDETESSSSTELVTYIFHPYEPFFISTQKGYSQYLVNFHMYNSYTKVEV